MAPSAFFKEGWGDPTPLKPNQLLPISKVNIALSKPESPFAVEEVTIGTRTFKTWKYLPVSYRDFWVEKAKLFGNRGYITYEGETYTYGQTWKASLLAAHVLSKRFGVVKGDRVGICSRNHLEHVISWWAAHLLGAVATELNAFADEETICFCIQDVGCKVLMCDVERLERVRGAINKQSKGPGGINLLEGKGSEPALQGIVVMPFGQGRRSRIPKQERQSYLQPRRGEPQNLIYDWEALMAEYESQAPSTAPQVDITPEDFATILFTSGTTGKPKGVISTQRQSLHSLNASLWVIIKAYVRRHRPVPDPTKNPDIPVTLQCFPLFHAAGLLSQLVVCTGQGQRLVHMYSWDVEEAISLMEKEGCSRFSAPAFMARQLALHPSSTPKLASISHGGSSSPSSLAQESYKKTEGGIVGNGYGATETNAFATGCYQDDYINWPQSAGFPAPTTEVIIVEPGTTNQVKQGETGEILIKGQGIASGYYNRPEATEETFLKDGYYRTGDVGHLNEEGALFISDRVKDLIIRGGENLSCAVVEDGVHGTFPELISEIAAVGLPDEVYGERVAVIIRLTPQGSKDLTEDKLIEAVKKRVKSKQHHPEFMLFVEEELPKIPAGKIDKKILREWVKEEAKRRGWKGAVKSKKVVEGRESKL